MKDPRRQTTIHPDAPEGDIRHELRNLTQQLRELRQDLQQTMAAPKKDLTRALLHTQRLRLRRPAEEPDAEKPPQRRRS